MRQGILFYAFMAMTTDQKYMTRALALARLGGGWVNPNPMVGALLVAAGRIIGEGYHEYFGGPHAEVNAIASVKPEDEKLIGEATLYVTLEPCSHHGKTPPCTDLIIRHGIVRVVAAMPDPNPVVNGKGFSLLQAAGVEVVTGCLENQAVKLNEVFIKYVTTGKPFVVLKSAMTLDGKIATVTNASRWITGTLSRKFVHRMRQELSAVMVGADTVIFDNPLLNIRLPRKKSKPLVPDDGLVRPAWKNPLKIVTDTRGRIPTDARIFTNDPQLTIIATTSLADKKKLKEIERTGAQVVVCPQKNNMVDLEYLVSSLGTMGVDSMMIEGGSKLAFSALRAGIVDKVMNFIAPRILGGDTAPTPVGGAGIETMEEAIRLKNLTTRKIGEDILVEGYL